MIEPIGLIISLIFKVFNLLHTAHSSSHKIFAHKISPFTCCFSSRLLLNTTSSICVHFKVSLCTRCSYLWFKHILFITRHDKRIGQGKKLCLALSIPTLDCYRCLWIGGGEIWLNFSIAQVRFKPMTLKTDTVIVSALTNRVLAGARTIIKVSSHQHRWLAGSYNLEIGHF